MSNKKNHKNYSSMSTKAVKEEVYESSLVEETVEASEPETGIPAEVIEEVEAVKISYGKVDNCTMLNVRSKPEANAPVVLVISKGTEVEINENDSTSDFYAVTVRNLETNNKIGGYCVKKFIKIK